MKNYYSRTRRVILRAETRREYGTEFLSRDASFSVKIENLSIFELDYHNYI